jgi:excisionase family DNA binding protein
MTMDNELRRALREKLTVTVPVAAKMLGLSLNPTYRGIQTGEIPSVRIGGKILVPTAALRKLLGETAA